MSEPEFGNEVACDNCGDEWSDTYTDGLCQECHALWLEMD
jgi:Zn finger protein HypA/HybF involved in hydrogenase expression